MVGARALRRAAWPGTARGVRGCVRWALPRARAGAAAVAAGVRPPGALRACAKGAQRRRAQRPRRLLRAARACCHSGLVFCGMPASSQRT